MAAKKYVAEVSADSHNPQISLKMSGMETRSQYVHTCRYLGRHAMLSPLEKRDNPNNSWQEKKQTWGPGVWW